MLPLRSGHSWERARSTSNRQRLPFLGDRGHHRAAQHLSVCSVWSGSIRQPGCVVYLVEATLLDPQTQGKTQAHASTEAPRNAGRKPQAGSSRSLNSRTCQARRSRGQFSARCRTLLCGLVPGGSSTLPGAHSEPMPRQSPNSRSRHQSVGLACSCSFCMLLCMLLLRAAVFKVLLADSGEQGSDSGTLGV